MSDHDLHECQPPAAGSIGQIWTCPTCGDAWRTAEGPPIDGDVYAWVRNPSIEK